MTILLCDWHQATQCENDLVPAPILHLILFKLCVICSWSLFCNSNNFILNYFFWNRNNNYQSHWYPDQVPLQFPSNPLNEQINFTKNVWPMKQKWSNCEIAQTIWTNVENIYSFICKSGARVSCYFVSKFRWHHDIMYMLFICWQNICTFSRQTNSKFSS